MINMVSAGEVGGFLDKVLLQIADNYEAEVKLRGKIKSAMTYPVVVFVMAILAVIGMLLFVVPIFAKMFSDLGGKLPAPTQILVNLSDGLSACAPVLLVALIAASVVWGRVVTRAGPARPRPAEAQASRSSARCSRRSRSAGSPQSRHHDVSGVPILQSLDIVGDTAGNVVLR